MAQQETNEESARDTIDISDDLTLPAQIGRRSAMVLHNEPLPDFDIPQGLVRLTDALARMVDSQGNDLAIAASDDRIAWKWPNVWEAAAPTKPAPKAPHPRYNHPSSRNDAWEASQRNEARYHIETMAHRAFCSLWRTLTDGSLPVWLVNAAGDRIQIPASAVKMQDPAWAIGKGFLVHRPLGSSESFRGCPVVELAAFEDWLGAAEIGSDLGQSDDIALPTHDVMTSAPAQPQATIVAPVINNYVTNAYHNYIVAPPIQSASHATDGAEPAESNVSSDKVDALPQDGDPNDLDEHEEQDNSIYGLKREDFVKYASGTEASSDRLDSLMDQWGTARYQGKRVPDRAGMLADFNNDFEGPIIGISDGHKGAIRRLRSRLDPGNNGGIHTHDPEKKRARR